MPIYAIIENEVVTNAIIAESQQIAETVCPDTIVIELAGPYEGVKIGFEYKDGVFIDPEKVEQKPVVK